MPVPLRVLILEDSEDDAELLLRELGRGGYEPNSERAESKAEMATALEAGEWDLVISDHTMPGFSATAALALMHEREVDIPFIIVSGTIGEETAVEAMAAGAGDYVMKNNLARLVPAIERELREAATRAQRRETEQAVQEGEARLRAVMENVVDAIVTTDEAGRVESVNPAAERLFGFQSKELVGESFAALIDDSYRAEYAAQFRAFAASEPVSILGVTRELVGRRGATSTFPMELALSEMRLGDRRMLIAVARNISERKKAEEQLQYLADHDALTGLPNRRRFEEELSRSLDYIARHGSRGATLVLDLDNFKYVNDTLGHRAGDELMRHVASILRGRLRASDLLARLGGDEFGVLLQGIEEQEAWEVAEDLLDVVRRRPLTIGERPMRVTTSIGLTLFGSEGVSAEDVLVEADIAMYQAKDAGRDRVVSYSPDQAVKDRLKAGFTWTERIREALDNDLFVLYCQPIFDLSRNRISQYELLLRMEEEDGSVALPGAFLPTAERFGLIEAIDGWVVRNAIRLLAEPADAGDRDLLVEINLSGKSIGDPELPRLIERELAESGVDPGKLIFEITETAAIANMEQARNFAIRLERLGCRFALDDFGAGFGSFYYLKYFPLDYLKIDGEFVRTLPRSLVDQRMVKAMVEIAGALGLKTIAEFVEDEATLALLKDYGVDFAQGYQIGRPKPAADVLAAGALS